MNPTRPVNFDPALRPTAAAPAVTPTGGRRSPLPNPAPDVARVRPLDRDAAMRILIEEVKLALIERFGTLPNAAPSLRQGADSSALVSDLARLLHALLSNLAADGQELPALMLERIEEAVLIGGQRAMEALAQLPLLDPAVLEAIEHMRWLLVRMVSVQAHAVRGQAQTPLSATGREAAWPLVAQEPASSTVDKGKRPATRPRRRADQAPAAGADSRLPYEVERDDQDEST